MAGRYSRFYSNYIFRKKHQNVNKGTIWERDWVTIGAKHQIEKGKRPFFGDSGFLYTINNIPSTKKRHNYGKWVASWLYSDVEDAKPTVNSVDVNYLSNDIRDFVYYGSCSELIRTAVMNIVAEYPAIMSTQEPPKPFKFYRQYDSVTYEVDSPGLKIQNYFNVDLIHSDVDAGNINLNRFLAMSYPNFNIRIKVKSQTIDDVFYFDEIYEYTVIQNQYYHKKSGFGLTQQSYDNLQPPQLKDLYEKIDYSLPLRCNVGINTTDIVIKAYNSEATNQKLNIKLKGYYFEDGYVFCLNSGSIIPGDTSSEVYGFNYSTNVTPTFNASTITPEFYIYPKKEVVEEFFENLSDFQKLLLRTDTLPLYKNTFLTPYETDDGMYYTYMDYVWPSKDGVIDIYSTAYIDYINKLYNLGEKLDEVWCDNLWRNMTHESIKNYDWTYTRTFIEGEEEDNILGGRRMESLIRIYGMFFDDLKRYIDGIKLSTRVTYDCFNNAPDAELSDKLDYMGWDVFSTIPVLYDGEEPEEAIENSFVIVSKTDVDGQITLEEYEMLSDDEKAKYEFKASDLSLLNLEPVADWFKSINPISITPLFMDNHFMRQLVLSSKYIFKTKGTRNSIDMVMALFGLGNDGNDDFYELTERYHYTLPYVYEDKLSQDINKLNHREDANYDEELYYEGIPIENTEIYNAKYIVPFYNHNKTYRGDFAFQSEGGWGADKEDLTQGVQFKETLSYLKVAGNIHDLLSLNPYDVSNGDIYFVIDLKDIVDYDETITEETIANVTHFFMCNNDIFTEKYSSWTNIEVTDAIYEKAMYLYNIISTDIGNNPHVGYGKYDLGQNYIDYMRNPFKYDLDNFVLDDDTSSEMWSIEFYENTKEVTETNGKVLDFVSNSEKRDKFFAEILREKEEKRDYVNKHMFEMDIAERQQMVNRIADINAILGNVEYYYNDKVFILTNKVRVDDKTPETYKKYFFNVILQYLMQVIPSTAILILKDFD